MLAEENQSLIKFSDAQIIIEEEVIMSKAFLLWQPFFEVLFTDNKCAILSNSEQEKENIIKILNNFEINLNPNFITKSESKEDSIFIFTKNPHTTNKFKKRIFINCSTNFDHIDIENNDLVLSIYSIYEIENKPKVLSIEILLKFLFLDPIVRFDTDNLKNDLNIDLLAFYNEEECQLTKKIMDVIASAKKLEKVKLDDLTLSNLENLINSTKCIISTSTCPAYNHLLKIFTNFKRERVS